MPSECAMVMKCDHFIGHYDWIHLEHSLPLIIQSNSICLKHLHFTADWSSNIIPKTWYNNRQLACLHFDHHLWENCGINVGLLLCVWSEAYMLHVSMHKYNLYHWRNVIHILMASVIWLGSTERSFIPQWTSNVGKTRHQHYHQVLEKLIQRLLNCGINQQLSHQSFTVFSVCA